MISCKIHEMVYYTARVKNLRVQTAREVTFYVFARVLYDTFHNKGVKSTSHNSIVKKLSQRYDRATN